MINNFITLKFQAFLQSQKARKIALRCLIALIIYAVLGFLVLPPLIKPVLIEKLGQALHRPVAIESLSINPFALSVTLDSMAIQEREGAETFASFNSLYLNLETSSLFRGGPVLREIRLAKPRLRIVRLKDKQYNVSDLIDEFMATPESDAPTPAFSLNNIQLTDGVVEFDDRPVEETHVINDINLSLPFISSMAYATDTVVEPSFARRV